MPNPPVELHVVSDATGETAARLVQALEAQFPDQEFVEIRHPRVESADDLHLAVNRMKGRPAVVVYTLVHPELREMMRTLCRRARLHYCDLLGQPIDAVARVSGQAATMTPGSRPPLNSAYCRLLPGAAIARTGVRRISTSRLGSSVCPTTLARSTSNSSAGGAIPFTTGTFAALWPR